MVQLEKWLENGFLLLKKLAKKVAVARKLAARLVGEGFKKTQPIRNVKLKIRKNESCPENGWKSTSRTQLWVAPAPA